MSVTQALTSIYKGGKVTNQIRRDPVGFFIDRCISLLVQCFVPIPLAGEVVVAFKMPLFYLACTILLGAVSLLLFLGTVLVTPSVVLHNLTQTITNTLGGSALTVPIDALRGYREVGFGDTDTPAKNPFGGAGLANSAQTAGFHDPDYYQQFGFIHEGIDLVPSNTYYSQNQAYALVKATIVFTTLTGMVKTYTDSYGALTVEVTNSAGTIKTVYKHVKQILVSNGVEIHAGEPVGVMGMTGFATGEHLHYEIRLNQNGSWVAVDPAGYIQ